MNHQGKICRKCGQEIGKDNDFCPFCGAEIKKRSSKLKIIAAALIIISAAVSLIPSRNIKDELTAFLPQAQNATLFAVVIPHSAENFINGIKEKISPSPTPEPISGVISDGEYKVGKDIAPGEYLLLNTSNDDFGYFDIYVGLFKGSRLDGDYFENNYFLTLNDGERVVFENINAVPLSEADKNLLPQNGAGMYKVGLNLDEGEYMLIPDKDYGLNDEFLDYSGISTPYYQLYGSEGVRNYNSIGWADFTTNGIVTVKNGEYLQLHGCRIASFDETEIDTTGSGTFKVGTHISAGEYVIFPSGYDDWGYFTLYGDNCGRYGGELSGSDIDGNYIITLTEGTYIYLRNAYMVPFEDAEIDTYGEGMFKVGVHIPAGTYKIEPIEESYNYPYYEILTGSNPLLSYYIESENPDEETYVTLNNGEYIHLVGCRIVK